MDLRTELLREHSLRQRNKIIKYIGSDKKRFSELISLLLAGPYRITQRAAWPLSEIAINHPDLVYPHMNSLLKFAGKSDVHDAVKRNVVRLLQFIDIPRKFHGKVADLCFNFLSDKKQPVAVRVFSMTVLGNLAKNLPELGKEIAIIVNEQLPYSSAGFISRARRVLKAIGKQ
jgi:hypothetical protein